MWYNYSGEPVGEAEEIARLVAREEMSPFDIASELVDIFGDVKYLLWCLRQKEFIEEFSEDIEKAIDLYFEENFEERNGEE